MPRVLGDKRSRLRNRGDDVDISRVLGEADVQLVSASESIDNTPSGMLLHGIMSSMAEFYSLNLSTEVKKGLSEKAKRGGTPTRAPLGYKNIRDYDEQGRRDSRVELDAERAPLIKLAFEEYAGGNWSLNSLSEHISNLGLTTPATRKLPAKPIGKRMLHTIFNNPYYKGIVRYNGAEYPGRHEALVSEATWEKVQEILRSHAYGERSRIHDHYLKSTVYCGKCGARLIITNTKSRSGLIYPYFVCSAKHNRRNKCKQKALLIDEVAVKIEQLYEDISFSAEFRNLLQQYVTTEIDKLAGQNQSEQEMLIKKKEKLEREQLKLLQAHYADAIPLALLKEEQDRIGKAIRNITDTLVAHQSEYANAASNFDMIFELLDDCGRIYKMAGDYERRCFNQAIFKEIRVCYDDDSGLSVNADYTEPFDMILDSGMFTLKNNFERNQGQSEPTALVTILDFLPENVRTTTNFFSDGSSKDVLVRLRGLEPPRFPTGS